MRLTVHLSVSVVNLAREARLGLGVTELLQRHSRARIASASLEEKTRVAQLLLRRVVGRVAGLDLQMGQVGGSQTE